jgi:alkylation response protein AidB-like acyl-CoA dehydrogenase
MPCGQSFANAVYFRIGVIAYNRFIGFKRLSCPQACWHHTMATLRWKLIQIAGRIVHHAGQVILPACAWHADRKLALDAEKLKLFRSVRQRCYEVAIAT